MLSKTLEATLHRAFLFASEYGHEYMTLEHLLLALTHDKQARALMTACGVNINNVRAELKRNLNDNHASQITSANHPPKPTAGFQRVIQRAASRLQNGSLTQMNGADLVAALFAERESHAVYFLQQEGMNRANANVALDAFRNLEAPKKRYQTDPRVPEDELSEDEDILESLCRNLTQLAAEKKLDPVVGREKEIKRTIQVLCRRSKNNPLLVGEPGVGKTAIAEGLAQLINKGKVPALLKGCEIYSLEVGNLVAGTRYRGDFEERVKELVKALEARPNLILFIDEIHMLIGTGSSSGNSGADAANLLKPALSSGRIRCIGATTSREYRKHFAKDQAFSRRFQKVNVGEPSQEETLLILEGVKSKFEKHHNVRYTPSALKAAISLSKRHLTERRFPDKAIDVLDEAGAAQHFKGPSKTKRIVDQKTVELVLSEITKMPIDKLRLKQTNNLKNLSKDLSKAIYGQDKAVEALSSAVLMARSGLKHPEKPMGSYLFSGPTGVGKTELARQLADTLGMNLLRFDMSEYREAHTVSRLIGSPPGYVGFDEGGLLTNKVEEDPNSVILLDEIEKAHPDLYNLLLQVMDHGTLTDAHGKVTDFRNAIIIMTSNVGAEELSRETIGFLGSAGDADLDAALKRTFTPEFRNRIDAVVAFQPLSIKTMTKVVDKFLKGVEDLLKPKKITLFVSDDARKWLAEHGLDPAYGARPLGRLIDETIKKPLSKEVLFGGLQKGGNAQIVLDRAKDELKLNVIADPKTETDRIIKNIGKKKTKAKSKVSA